MKVLYFGCWGGAGHYVFMPDGHTTRAAGPWSARDLDTDPYVAKGGRIVWVDPEGLYPADAQETQGVWKLRHARDINGVMWTALGCWDRTQDARMGSRACFVAEGEHDEPSMRAIAAQHFPVVWARITGGAS